MQYAGLLDHIIATKNVLENPHIAINVLIMVIFVSIELVGRTNLSDDFFGNLGREVSIST